MEERGTMGEIKSLVLVISGDGVKSSPKKWKSVKKKKKSKSSNVLEKEEVARCVKES